MENKPVLISMHNHYAGRKRVERNLESANLHGSIYYGRGDHVQSFNFLYEFGKGFSMFIVKN